MFLKKKIEFSLYLDQHKTFCIKIVLKYGFDV